MVVYNNDGSVYDTNQPFQQFDPCNSEMDLFNSIDQESIELGGSPVYYYEVFVQKNTVDMVHMEDRGKIWSPCPICLYTKYEPNPGGFKMTPMGADGIDEEVMFEFNYKDVLKRIGHAPKVGSRLFTPHRKENWKITRLNLEGFQMWGEIRLQILATRFIESLTTGEGKSAPNPPVNYSIDAIRGGPDFRNETIDPVSGLPVKNQSC